MQAVILAGGLGTRLRPITEEVPKAMVPANGQPFLLTLLELLKSQGIIDVVLCIGYQGEKVKDFFGDGARVGLTVVYSEEKGKLLGTGGAIKQAQNLLDECTFIINGDTYLPINYMDVAKAFHKLGKQSMMVVYDNYEYTGVRNNVKLDQETMVIKHDKAADDCDYVEAGVLILKREVMDYLKEGEPVSLGKGLYPTLIRQRQMAAYITQQRFYDIGTPQQLRVFEDYLRRGKR